MTAVTWSMSALVVVAETSAGLVVDRVVSIIDAPMHRCTDAPKSARPCASYLSGRLAPPGTHTSRAINVDAIVAVRGQLGIAGDHGLGIPRIVVTAGIVSGSLGWSGGFDR